MYGWRWWRRLVVAGWMLAALVLVRSYAGNLMSVLAVRHVRQPYQSLRDVLDDPAVTMIWQTNTSNVQYFRSVESGIYREVREAEKDGRIKFHTLSDFYHVINTLVRPGHHVLIDVGIVNNMMIGYDVTFRGRCDFYTSREKFLPLALSMIGQKDSPLVPAISKRVMSLTEAGLYATWLQYMVPNSTYCAQSPTKITVSTTLAVTNLWGLLVVLAGCHGVGLLVLLAETTLENGMRWMERRKLVQ
ncbi:hypothetical protein Pmani_017227 [Petrolisthes manimaculis]|uniref:Ionotropic glutamate receptor C-terminal domain-containing protein n=1 Tax=Petrolisthes manimaculis TaxID=1843537 RepID=A0AAE1PM82_9EUCA|nr:hypothetical protein Pmani_017225 [Petrolisthes manimaculis]KAK4311250.1 hypothetical protein Pmani_017227 [Petrolisthes manimaculis]